MATSEPKFVLSFRHLLAGAIEEFLRGEGMERACTTEAMAELLVTLARYREEGTSLFPLVFLGDDRERMMRSLGCMEPLEIGAGPSNADTVRRALKVCGPIAQGSWSIFLERRDQDLVYGVFRSDVFALHETPMQRLRLMCDPSARILGAMQLADNVLELRGGSGAMRLVYLSGARSDVLPWQVTGRMVRAVVRDVESDLRAHVAMFYKQVLLEVMRAPHGALIAVVPHDQATPLTTVDGAMLPQPISVSEAVSSYRVAGSEAARARVVALAQLLRSMIGSDGITVVRSDGAILGFHLFVGHRLAPAQVTPIGGARRRTYETLVEQVGRGLLAVLYRSQDGALESVSSLSE